jgi:hypothetical protein
MKEIGTMKMTIGTPMKKLTKEQFNQFVEEYYSKPIIRQPMTIPVGLEEYNYIHINFEWEKYKTWNICNKYWVYIPKRVNGIIQLSLWQKHSLCKVRIDCNAGEYKYHSYYGTKLISKSNKIIHAVKELLKYK